MLIWIAHLSPIWRWKIACMYAQVFGRLFSTPKEILARLPSFLIKLVNVNWTRPLQWIKVAWHSAIRTVGIATFSNELGRLKLREESQLSSCINSHTDFHSLLVICLSSEWRSCRSFESWDFAAKSCKTNRGMNTKPLSRWKGLVSRAHNESHAKILPLASGQRIGAFSFRRKSDT